MEKKQANEAGKGTVWDGLAIWITNNGGHVDSRLCLQTKQQLRGVVARENIPKGTLLISLPESLSINGLSMPKEYNIQGESRIPASHWLRTLASLLSRMIRQQDAAGASDFFAPYIKSLPETYETLWEWEEAELSLLESVAIVPPSSFTTPTNSNGRNWGIDRQELHDRFQNKMRFYFSQVLGGDEKQATVKFDTFVRACQIVSTRGFHGVRKETSSSSKAVTSYPGPYLLPAIDMLNHACYSHSPQDGDDQGICCTLLHCNSNGDFMMYAERDILQGEELLHSYGPDLTSGQFLATFGFIPYSHIIATIEMDRLLSGTTSTIPSVNMTLLFPESEIFGACQTILADTQWIEGLCASLLNQDPEVELWELPSVAETKESATTDSSYSGTSVVVLDVSQLVMKKDQDESLLYPPKLPDEMVTALCTPFLPDMARQELSSTDMLDSSILADPFLGRLVGKVLVGLADKRLDTYTPIDTSKLCFESSRPLGNGRGVCCMMHDTELLSLLVGSSDIGSKKEERYKFALTVRVQEKRATMLLRKIGECLAQDSLGIESSRPSKRKRKM